MRGPARALALAAAVVALAATQARAAAPAGTPPIFRREDSLVVAGRWAESEALLDSLARTAHARGDARLELQALLQRGGRRAFRGRFDDGIRDLRAALALAPQVGDTALWFTTLRVLALDELNAGRLQDASPVLREAGRLARAVDAPGRARLAMLRAYAQLLANHFARAAPLYRGAARELAACGLAGEALEAEVGLARACDGLGDEDAARDAYAEVIARSAGLAHWTSAANAWNNLGNLELTGGDPATALVDWSRALALYREYGKTDFALSTRLNVALALEAQARYDEAAAAAESVATLARANGDPGHERRARLALAGIRIEQERPADALAAADSVLARGAGLPPDDRADAALVRVRALAALLRFGPARAAAESLATDRDLSPWQRTQVRRATVEVELRDGRPRAALARLDAARAGPAAADDWYDHLLRSRAEEALGGHAAALAELERAAAGWERWRGTPRDPEWREARGPQARMLYEAFDRA
ncbi:MAG TPA: tetratricopeptide repeat protein, partial [Candidatus Eisenbacteria bacterium]|nr:tetratricopeptide repeat protein [Candidatus Eisenbacteria bacterium]